jgi:hypothetical protein
VNLDTGEYRALSDEEMPKANEILVSGTVDQLEKLSRFVRRGIARSEGSDKSLEERIGELERQEAERNRQLAMRSRAKAIGLVIPQ